MRTLYSPESEWREQAGYFEASGANLYTVLHRVKNPIARMLLIGPIAAERHTSYIPWVRWARYLASRRVEVLRYDYRGTGESEGIFEEMSFSHWSEDVELLAAWLKGLSPNLPIVVHGLEVGAILAGRAFQKGIGDLLLLWSPPANANQALRSALLRWINVVQLFKYGNERKPPSAFIRELEQGSVLEVDGYQWSSKLWRDSFDFGLPTSLVDEGAGSSVDLRPVRISKLGKEAAPLVRGGVLGYDESKDFEWLFVDNWDWIKASLQSIQETTYEADN